MQFAEKAVFAPGDAREDWTILRALADALDLKVGFDSFAELQGAMIADVPALGEEGLAAYPVKDFYLTNAIARASAVMQQWSAELLGPDLAEAAE